MIPHPNTMSMELIGWLWGRIGTYQPCDSSIGSIWYMLILPTDAHKGGNLSYIGLESQVYLSYMKLKTLFMSSFASGNIQFLVEIMPIPLVNDIHQMSIQDLHTTLKFCHFGDEQSWSMPKATFEPI